MKQYDVIYADPAWEYRNKKTGGSHKSGAAQHYATMTTNDICALPISQLGKKNSVLFLWATVPMLEDAQRVMKAWGYKYKTLHVWHKVMSKGMGYWWRGQCEILLFGVRGKVKAFRMQESNHMQAHVGRHSEKPDLFRQKIERAAAKGGLIDRVELFARVHATGWDVWGHDVAQGIDMQAYNQNPPPNATIRKPRSHCDKLPAGGADTARVGDEAGHVPAEPNTRLQGPDQQAPPY